MPAPSTAASVGPKNWAALPLPSAAPLCPPCPATVLTTRGVGTTKAATAEVSKPLALVHTQRN